MRYETERLTLRTINISDLELFKDYLIRNQAFLSEWEPEREDDYYSDVNILDLIENEIASNLEGSGLRLHISLKGEERIIGSIALSNIVRGPFQSCFIGYKLDQDEINKGYMTEALKKIIDIAFKEFKLHRIEANIMPKNQRSIKVVTKAGFEYEGLSKRYLKINGIWEDHAHYTILNSALE
ncbi:MAG: GNAT family N-acetyltransferase [Clostridia bacterium]|nr:GNAT family N-acetyltransferase [Clostridia bacterium]